MGAYGKSTKICEKYNRHDRKAVLSSPKLTTDDCRTAHACPVTSRIGPSARVTSNTHVAARGASFLTRTPFSSTGPKVDLSVEGCTTVFAVVFYATDILFHGGSVATVEMDDGIACCALRLKRNDRHKKKGMTENSRYQILK